MGDEERAGLSDEARFASTMAFGRYVHLPFEVENGVHHY
jgi:hypothetical protein